MKLHPPTPLIFRVHFCIQLRVNTKCCQTCEAAGGPAAVWCHSGLLPRRSSALSSSPAAGPAGRPPIPCNAQSLKIHQCPRRRSHCNHWDQTTLFCSPMHTFWPCVCSARRNWSSTLFLSSVVNMSDKDESRWSLKVTCWETSAAAQIWTLPLCQFFLWILHKNSNSIYC